MKILITGSNGMLGQELAKSFASHTVLTTTSKQLDITNPDQTSRIIEDIRPEIIINAAAFNDVDGAEISEELAKISDRVNSLGPLYLARASRNIGAVFIHYSTNYVFDGKNFQYPEDSPVSPISKHGRAKSEGEKNVNEIGGKFYIIRLSRLFGKISKSDIGKKSFFQKIFDLSGKKERIKLVDDEISCFTYAPDLAASTKKLIFDRYDFGTYHHVNEEPLSWYEGARRMFNIFGISDKLIEPVSSTVFYRPAKIPKISILLNTKFPRLRDFDEALLDWKEHFDL